MDPRDPLPLLRQRSREAAFLNNSTGGTDNAPSPSPSPCAAHLAACAAARSAKDLEGCLRSARAALKKDAACCKAWAFLCWSLFELRRYHEASAECLRALSHRSWPIRDREGMVALRTSCALLAELSPAAGDQLRGGWYQKRLRALYDAGELHEYEKGAETEITVGGRLSQYIKEQPRGVGREELSLLDRVSAGAMQFNNMGGEGEICYRTVPAGLLVGGERSIRDGWHSGPQLSIGGPNFPAEQALGGVVYLKEAILPFHCDKRFGPLTDEHGNRAADRTKGRYHQPDRPKTYDDHVLCYQGYGPCLGCIEAEFPIPTHRFPVWTPALAAGATVTQPNPDMDVFYSTNSVPARLHRQLTAQLDALASKGASTQAMPKYHTLIDPNLNAVDGKWVPSEFDAIATAVPRVDLVIAVELACLAATGRRLPFGFGNAIATLATKGDPAHVRADCAMRSPIPDLDPHTHHKLHACTQKLMGAALPILAKLRRPALLLPGPLQAAVKAQVRVHL